MSDYISREEMHQTNKNAWEGVMGIHGGCTIFSANTALIDSVPAADVRPMNEISDSVDEVIDYLNSVSNQMPYHVYSALFDLICGICPTSCAKVKEIGGDEDGDYELLTSESSKNLTSADKHFRKVTAAELAKFIKRYCPAIMGDDAVIEVEANGAAHING